MLLFLDSCSHGLHQIRISNHPWNQLCTIKTLFGRRAAQFAHNLHTQNWSTENDTETDARVLAATLSSAQLTEPVLLRMSRLSLLTRESFAAQPQPPIQSSAALSRLLDGFPCFVDNRAAAWTWARERNADTTWSARTLSRSSRRGACVVASLSGDSLAPGVCTGI